jgi:hypothetical protein
VVSTAPLETPLHRPLRGEWGAVAPLVDSQHVSDPAEVDVVACLLRQVGRLGAVVGDDVPRDGRQSRGVDRLLVEERREAAGVGVGAVARVVDGVHASKVHAVCRSGGRLEPRDRITVVSLVDGTTA